MKTYDQFPIFEGINWETSVRATATQPVEFLLRPFDWRSRLRRSAVVPVVPHGKISMGNDGLVGGLEHFLD